MTDALYIKTEEGLVKVQVGASGEGGGVDVDDALDSTSINPVENKVIVSALAGKQDVGNYVTYAANSEVTAGKYTGTTYKYGQSPMVVENGLIVGGSAKNAGLVTRGICGVTAPNASTGACTTSELYINYDGEDTYSRQLVLGAGTVGTAISTNTASSTTATNKYGNIYSAVRGDQMVNYVIDKLADHPKTQIETLTYSITTAATTAQSYSLGTFAYLLVFVNSTLAVNGTTYGITNQTTLQFNDILPVGTEVVVVKFITEGSVVASPTYSIDSALSATSTNAVQNKVINTALGNKADSSAVTALNTKLTSLQSSIDSAYAKYVAELG